MFYSMMFGQDIVVVDSDGEWLQSWIGRLLRMGTKHLRMPVSHCPGNPGALHDYVRNKGANQARFP